MTKKLLWLLAAAACAAAISACCGSSSSPPPPPSSAQPPPPSSAQPAPPPSSTQPGSPPQAAPQPAPQPQSPPASGSVESVAQRYLRAGGAGGDSSVVPGLVDPACYGNEKAMRVDAVRIMGVPLTLSQVTVTKTEDNGQMARVRYKVSGSTQGEEGSTKIGNFSFKVKNLKMSSVNLEGTLPMKNVGGQWKVSCE